MDAAAGGGVSPRKSSEGERTLAFTPIQGCCPLKGLSAKDGAALYPIFLRVEGRRLLIVGGGGVAARKARQLLQGGAEVTVVAQEFGPAMVRLASCEPPDKKRRGKVTLKKRRFSKRDLASVDMVFAADRDPLVNAQVVREARKRGVLVNAADDPSHCDFYAGAILREKGVTIAISSSGESPALVAFLKKRWKRELTAAAAYSQVLAEHRPAVQGAFVQLKERLKVLRQLVTEEMFLLFLRSRKEGEAALKEEVEKILTGRKGVSFSREL